LQDTPSSQESNPYLYAVPSTDGGQQSTGEAAPAQTYVVLCFKDGSSYAVSDYWLAGGRLHYVTSYGGENAIDEAQLDLQRTVNENAARGVEFTLKPARSGEGTSAPATPGETQQGPQQ
jgi:hypothetical protein